MIFQIIQIFSYFSRFVEHFRWEKAPAAEYICAFKYDFSFFQKKTHFPLFVEHFRGKKRLRQSIYVCFFNMIRSASFFLFYDFHDFHDFRTLFGGKNACGIIFFIWLSCFLFFMIFMIFNIFRTFVWGKSACGRILVIFFI